jgi:molybdopterin synthase sulfur carrier subunit
MIRVLYFASLRERLGLADEVIDRQPGTVAELRAELARRGDHWREAFAGDATVMVAVNQAMADNDQVLADGDEVGFFPPVTGG